MSAAGPEPRPASGVAAAGGPAGGGAPRDGLGAAERALFTDLYQLAMLQAYAERDMLAPATFELYARSLPAGRNYLLACGLDDALAYLEGLRFGEEALAALDRTGRFPARFLGWLAELRFRGEVHAPPEGTPLFAGEPLLRVTAALPEAQLVETYLLNRLHFQTAIASKGARVVAAAQGRPVFDFGTRRAHGADAALQAARALWIAGLAGTSNVLAGTRHGIPLAGTMAHSYVQAVGDELAAFRAFAAIHPGTVLLADTYDAAAGVRNAARVAATPGGGGRVRAVRLDSEPLDALAREARAILDRAGLARVGIFASGGLDEQRIAELVAADAPIDAFGVGTRAVTSADAPAFDAVYKLVAYDGRGSVKLSPGKATLPGPKQVFRLRDGEGLAAGDVIARAGEWRDGEPLLEPVMRGGERLAAGRRTLAGARGRAARELGRLPAPLRALAAPAEPYPVRVSAALRADGRALREELRRGG